FLIPAAAAAQATAVDPDLARLQAAEAAVRAGRNTHPPMIVNNRAAATAGEQRPLATSQSAPRALATPVGAPREFPLPPRSDVQPATGNVQALIAAGMARPTPAAKAATGDAEATAAGLD